jgi:predicted RND superfamily exporter protein
MWKYLVRLILRQRIAVVIVIALLTIFMAWKAWDVQLSYELAKMLPASDSTYVEYETFKTRFGEDGNVFAVGIKDDKLFQLNKFNALYDLCNELRNLDGIEEVVSITRTLNIVKNDSTKKFDFKQLIHKRPTTQVEVDSLKKLIFSLPFYNGLLYNEKQNSYLIGITLDKNKINDKGRVELVGSIKDRVEKFRKEQKTEVHYSGLPYIRTETTQKIKFELFLFILLSLIIAIVIMILFFKSARVVFASVVLVIVSVIWSLGTISLFNFKITILSGVIPSLLVIIAIENCIYLINKYHWEYRLHGNKVRALSSMVQRIGFATLMTNATTATGFAAFIFTSNTMLREFGIVTSINVMVEYLMSIILIPIIFSFLIPPTQKQTMHLENKSIRKFIDKIKFLIANRRNQIYITCGVFIIICIYGMTWMHTSGKVVDDLRESDPIFVDLKFFEKNFAGVMPFEISIDTKKKNGVMKLSTINKIDELQQALAKYPIFSKPISLAEFVKFSRQAFYDGDPEQYQLPDNMEKDFILSYLPTKIKGKKNMLHSFIDSTKRYTRISVQMADVGTKEVNLINQHLRPCIDSIFDPAKYTVAITGNSVVYTKGTDFLIKNLLESVLIGIILISLIVAIVFSSYRMVVIAMICNIIPLLITAAIMGFASIPVKPSTLIVFTVALGISIDNAILFLSKYRHELKLLNGDIKKSVMNALDETGISMIYSSIVLVLGYGIFIISGFGGTQALGMLISITLFMALFFNIIVLPSLILTFDKIGTTKAFRQPIIDIYYNDDDIDLEELKIEQPEYQDIENS